MRVIVVAIHLVLLVGLGSVPALAQDTQKPEAIMEKMAFKFVRGVTNLATSVVELPKQSYLTVRDRGTVGYVIGPIKGFGMGLYRAVIGTVEAVTFMVPQPGYYDPIIEPEYVWQGWEDRRPDSVRSRELTQTGEAGGKGE